MVKVALLVLLFIIIGMKLEVFMIALLSTFALFVYLKRTMNNAYCKDKRIRHLPKKN
jgi:hypothetical protein